MRKLAVVREEARLLRAVRVHRVELLETGGGAVVVLPARVGDTPVVHQLREERLHLVEAEAADVRAVGVAAEEVGDGERPAIDRMAAARGLEHDRAVGEPARLDVAARHRKVGLLPRHIRRLVGRSPRDRRAHESVEGELLQGARFEVKREEVVVGGREVVAHGEDERFSVEVQVGVADGAVGLLDQHFLRDGAVLADRREHELRAAVGVVGYGFPLLVGGVGEVVGGVEDGVAHHDVLHVDEPREVLAEGGEELAAPRGTIGKKSGIATASGRFQDRREILAHRIGLRGIGLHVREVRNVRHGATLVQPVAHEATLWIGDGSLLVRERQVIRRLLAEERHLRDLHGGELAGELGVGRRFEYLGEEGRGRVRVERVVVGLEVVGVLDHHRHAAADGRLPDGVVVAVGVCGAEGEVFRERLAVVAVEARGLDAAVHPAASAREAHAADLARFAEVELHADRFLLPAPRAGGVDLAVGQALHTLPRQGLAICRQDLWGNFLRGSDTLVASLSQKRRERRFPEDHNRQKHNLHRMSPKDPNMTVDIIAYFSFFCIVPSRQKVVRNC